MVGIRYPSNRLFFERSSQYLPCRAAREFEDKSDSIVTTTGNIFMEAGGGGIDIGNIETGSPNPHVPSGTIELFTSNEGPISTGHLKALGGSEASILVVASGDLKISGDNSNGAVWARTHNTGSDFADSAIAEICLQSIYGSIEIDHFVEAWSHGKTETISDIHIHAA